MRDDVEKIREATNADDLTGELEMEDESSSLNESGPGSVRRSLQMSCAPNWTKDFV